MSPWQRRTLLGKVSFSNSRLNCGGVTFTCIFVQQRNSQIALEHEKWPSAIYVSEDVASSAHLDDTSLLSDQRYLQCVTSGSDLHMIIILYCKGDTFTTIRIHGTSSHHPFLAVSILLLPPSEIDHVRISLDLHTGPTGPAGTKRKTTSEVFYQLLFRETGIIKILPKRRIEDVASIDLPTRKVTQQAGKSPNLLYQIHLYFWIVFSIVIR